jgi:pimeloyl-ACP methyl ester carboxylesterase
MKDDNVESMDRELHGLLRRGAPNLSVPEGAHARILERLATTLPIDPSPRGGGGSGSGGAPTAPTPSPNAAPTRLFSAQGFAVVALGFALGAGVATAVLLPRPESVRVVYVDRAAPVVPALGTTEPAAIPFDALPKSAPSSPTPSAPQKPLVPPSASPAIRLNEERALVDEARVAYSRGDTIGCLAMLEKHRTLHPNGLLSEEREALAVRALVATGRMAEARERGHRFATRYPASVMLPAVLSALEEVEKQ